MNQRGGLRQNSGSPHRHVSVTCKKDAHNANNGFERTTYQSAVGEDSKVQRLQAKS